MNAELCVAQGSGVNVTCDIHERLLTPYFHYLSRDRAQTEWVTHPLLLEVSLSPCLGLVLPAQLFPWMRTARRNVVKKKRCERSWVVIFEAISQRVSYGITHCLVFLLQNNFGENEWWKFPQKKSDWKENRTRRQRYQVCKCQNPQETITFCWLLHLSKIAFPTAFPLILHQLSCSLSSFFLLSNSPTESPQRKWVFTFIKRPRGALFFLCVWDAYRRY